MKYMFNVLWVLTVTISLMLSVSIARADQWWSAVAWSCDEEMGHLIVFPIRFDANLEMPSSHVGRYVPMAEGWDNLREKIEVLNCSFSPNHIARMYRTYLNSPKPWGNCGGAPYSIYSLSINGMEAARFSMGCSDSLLIIDRNLITLCSLGGNESSCRISSSYGKDHTIGDLQLNYLGAWAQQ